VQVKRIGYRVKGFLAVADRGLYWDMICKSAEQRLNMLLFWERHGLRAAHPNLGKEKLFGFIQRFCQAHALPTPSVRTVGRLIADAPDKMRHAALRRSRFHQG
jgi:hypothetical protein